MLSEPDLKLSAGYQQNLFGRPAQPYYDEPIRKYDMTYISFGAGVQSTALLIASALGWFEVPKAKYAIFADTQAELQVTTNHVEYMRKWAEPYGIEVVTCSLGDLERGVLAGGNRGKSGTSWDTIPAFTKDETGKRGILRRACTWDFKIFTIRKKVRELLGLKPGEQAKGRVYVRTMLGISMDEVIRMKPAREEWMYNAHPLIDAGIDRDGCKEIIKAAGVPMPPKSSCYFCPFHSDSYWVWLQEEHPSYWQKAVEFDSKIRRGMKGVSLPVFLHDSLEPLDQVDFDRRKKKGGWGNECSGVCGV